MTTKIETFSQLHAALCEQPKMYPGLHERVQMLLLRAWDSDHGYDTCEVPHGERKTIRWQLWAVRPGDLATIHLNIVKIQLGGRRRPAGFDSNGVWDDGMVADKTERFEFAISAVLVDGMQIWRSRGRDEATCCIDAHTAPKKEAPDP